MNFLNKNPKIIIPLVVLAVVFIFSEFYASGKKEKIYSDLKPVEIIPHEINAINKLLQKSTNQPKLIRKKFINEKDDDIYAYLPQTSEKQSNKKPIYKYPTKTLSEQKTTIVKPVQTTTGIKPVKADTSNLNLNAKTLLRITGAKSVGELNNPNEEVHGIRIYYKSYKRCEIEVAKANYLYNKRDEFKQNLELAKLGWKKYIKKRLDERLNTLTKDNLIERLNKCKLETQQIVVKLYEFDKNWKNWIRKN